MGGGKKWAVECGECGYEMGMGMAGCEVVWREWQRGDNIGQDWMSEPEREDYAEVVEDMETRMEGLRRENRKVLLLERVHGGERVVRAGLDVVEDDRELESMEEVVGRLLAQQMDLKRKLKRDERREMTERALRERAGCEPDPELDGEKMVRWLDGKWDRKVLVPFEEEWVAGMTKWQVRERLQELQWELVKMDKRGDQWEDRVRILEGRTGIRPDFRKGVLVFGNMQKSRKEGSSMWY